MRKFLENKMIYNSILIRNYKVPVSKKKKKKKIDINRIHKTPDQACRAVKTHCVHFKPKSIKCEFETLQNVLRKKAWCYASYIITIYSNIF